MGDFGDGAMDSADKKAGGEKRAKYQNNSQGVQDGSVLDEHALQESGASAFGSLSEATAESYQRLVEASLELTERASKLILDKLPLVLEVPVLAGGREKSYSMVLDLDGEVARKFANPNVPQPVKDFYKATRQQQMEHGPIGLEFMQTLNPQEQARYAGDWAEMNAWLAFPETDEDCQEGRKIYQEYIKHALERTVKGPLNEEEQKKVDSEDNPKLAKLYSLMQNDHDYLHNEDELVHDNPTRHFGMHHLPDKFNGIGLDGKEKEFDLKTLAEKHMLEVLQNTYKSPLKPDERGNLAFYSQVLRQVLPQELLDDAHKAERQAILTQYVSLYSARDMDLSRAGEAVWQEGMNLADNEYPGIAKLHPGLQPMASEGLYELFTLTDIRQLAVEAHEMRTVAGILGKPSELAYPDQERLHEFSKIKTPMREYEAGQVLAGRNFMSHVFQAAAGKYGELTPQEKLRLNNWQAKPNNWQLVYWGDDPNTEESKIQVEIIERFPRSLQCSFSSEGAKLLSDWKGGKFVQDTNRMNALAAKLPCIHDDEPRRKDNIK